MSIKLFNLYGVNASIQQEGGDVPEEEDFPAAESDAQWKYDIEDNGLAYRVHEFTLGDNMSFEVTKEGDFERLIIGAGGSGGGDDGGGGGGGQVIADSVFLTKGIYNVTVEDGGATAENQDAGSAGGNSSFDTLVAFGGGGGNSANGSGQQGFNAGGGSKVNQASVSPNGGNQGGSGDSGGGGGGASVGTNGNSATGSAPGDGADGVVSSITGTSIRYGAGGAGADTNTYAIGGDFGGGKSGPGSQAIGARNGYGAGGGASGRSDQFSGKGGYGRVIVRHRVDTINENYGQAPPEPVSIKYLGLWDAHRRVFNDSLPFWGNVIKAKGTQEQLVTMYQQTGLPVIWSGFGLSSSQDESEWIQRITSKKSIIQDDIGSDNMYWILIEDEPSGFDYEELEHLTELCRQILNTNGHKFKFGYTVKQIFAYSVGPHQKGHFDPMPGNADYIAINNYIFRSTTSLYGSINNQNDFNEVMDKTMTNVRSRVGPNTRFSLTMQAFYGYNDDKYIKPPDLAPYWWAEYVMNTPDIDGILCYEWWNSTESNGTGLRDTTMSAFWENLQDAYDIYFSNQ